MVNSLITYCDLVVSSEILLTECQASIIFCSISFQTMKNKKGKTFLKDKRYLSLLEFKRCVTISLLLYGLNDEIGRKGDAPEARLMKGIPLSAEPDAKRRKDRLSVPDEIGETGAMWDTGLKCTGQFLYVQFVLKLRNTYSVC